MDPTHDYPVYFVTVVETVAAVGLLLSLPDYYTTPAMVKQILQKKPNASISRLSKDLLRWYDDNARALPWRIGPGERKAGHRPNPYHVWLSEIMLQQTTVATVAPRFQEFLDRWPAVTDMAASPVEEITGAWAGLGYYARARNLHKCAVIVSNDYNGKFPDNEDALRALPGIGDYTAAAIAAIAFNQRAVVMDGNIERVTARLFSETSPLPGAKPALKKLTASYWPGIGKAERHGDFAQSLMDLGASVCRPKAPLCLLCPIRSYCSAHKNGDETSYPVKAAKKTKPTRFGTAFVLQRADGAVAFERRPDKGLLGGMLGLPGSEWREDGNSEVTKKDNLKNAPAKIEWVSAGEAHHTFTHFHLVLNVYLGHMKAVPKLSQAYEWQQPTEVRLPTVMKKALSVGIG